MHTRQLAVERYMTLLEPQNLDDTLTLAILLDSHLGLHMDDYPSSPASRDDDGLEQSLYREERARISDLVEKVVRGLMRVANSPLTLDSRAADFSFDQQFDMALTEAKRLNEGGVNA